MMAQPLRQEGSDRLPAPIGDVDQIEAAALQRLPGQRAAQHANRLVSSAAWVARRREAARRQRTQLAGLVVVEAVIDPVRASQKVVMQRDRHGVTGAEADREDRRRKGPGPLVDVDHRGARPCGEQNPKPVRRLRIPHPVTERLRWGQVPDVGEAEPAALDQRMLEQ